MLATGNPEFPLRVACVGQPRRDNTDQLTPGTPERDVPEIVQVRGWNSRAAMVMHVTSSSINENGHPGNDLRVTGQSRSWPATGVELQLCPERPFTDEIDPETSESVPAEDIGEHHRTSSLASGANKQPNAGMTWASACRP